MSTPSIKKGEIERQWLLIDAEGQVLGRLASQVASLLKGKHRPQFTPHADAGDFVVIVNASKVKLSGNKLTDKKYYKHTGFIGGIRETTAAQLQAKHPEDVIIHAVRRMLPRSPLGRSLMRKLHVYAGAEHEQVAQAPTPYQLPY